jgi:predicted CxxxxCH...CXXCH cytochrome family protein
VAQPAHPHPQNTGCASCHAGYTATTVTAAIHVDGVVNKTTAGCTACHGELPAAGVTLTNNLVAAAPGATGTNTVDSTGQTATTSAGVGAHRAHLSGTTFRSTPIGCTECHALPPSNTDTAHANSGTGTGGARANVLFGPLATDTAFGARTPSYSGSATGAGGTTGGTCASTYCHAPRADSVTGLNQTPSWASPGTVLCGDCHGLPPVAAAHPVNALCGQCHPGYPNSPTATTVLSAAAKLIHLNGTLDGGESSGATPCLNCHKTDAATGAAYGKMVSDTTVYHHVVAEGTTFKTYPLTATGQACLQCHADHDVFNPALNAANTLGRGANLRTTIATAPTKVAPASGNYANTDFSGTAGICLSCHSAAIAKSTTAQKSDGSTTTHVISGSLFGASAHAYGVAGSFSSGPSAFTANCMKCHSDERTATYPEKQGGAFKFALHTSVDRRLLNPLGMSAPADNMEEKFCYRCHSASTDVTPGGGPAKATTASDAYGAVTTMSAGSTSLYAAMQEGTAGSSGTTQAATTLYLRNTATVNAVESSLPTAYILASGTYAGTTTFSQYDMALAAGATGVARTNTSGTTTGRYLRFGQFVSPAVATAVTIPSGSTFLINTRAQVSAAGDTENERFQIWRRTAAGVNTALNTATQQQATALTTTATNRTYSFVTNTAVTLAPGDGLVLEIETLKGSTTTSTVTENYGNFATDAASLVLPVSITFQTSAAAAAAGRHDVGAYSGIHQPTEAAAGAGGVKHVECADCHEPHAARSGTKPATNNNLVWGPITGVTGAVPTWSTVNFTAPTGYTAISAATTEYQICFKCHSGANANLATWGAGDWTDLAQEFSPANRSRHPVASALGATGSGSTVLAASQLIAPWTPGMVMTCSDCHGGDAASPAAQGPHGSAVKYMLKGTNRAWPFTTAGATTGQLYGLRTNASGNNTLAPASGTANGLFCMNCHPNPTTTNNIHVAYLGENRSQHNVAEACVACHVRIPHGGKVSRLMATTNAPARYRTSGITPNLAAFKKDPAGTYSTPNQWFQAATACGTHTGTLAGSEAW